MLKNLNPKHRVAAVLVRSFMLILLASAIVACQSLPALIGGQPSSVKHAALSAGGVYKSPGDSREYRYLTLDNQIKVLLIADDTAEKAAASLDVHVGSRHDPIEWQGLAHFLEHMLFLGTEKYPQADEYQQFISANGGSHNAFTSFEHTNYFFDIDNQSLADALDRFADFFVAPLFNAEYVGREVNAVESEYRARIKDEERRIVDASQQVVNPNHPFRKFTVGSLTTFATKSTGSGSDSGAGTGTVREAMLDFYQRYYSGSRMSLVVIGNYSLDELEALVRPRFVSVNNNGKTTQPVTEPLFSANDKLSVDGKGKHTLPLLLAVQAEKPMRQLRYTFAMPDLLDSYRTKPLNYIGNILGHEGKGSLLSQLKAAGWAEALGTGVGLNYRGGATFQINIALTEQGVTQIKSISEQVFYAINYLTRQHHQQPKKTRALYLEQRQLADMSFRFFRQPSEVSAVVSAASSLHFYPSAEVIYGAYDYSHYDPELIADRLSRLRPDNVLITLVAQSLPESYAATDTSPWFGAPYSVHPISADWLENWQSASSDGLFTRALHADALSTDTLSAATFSLPAPNNFIPHNFELVAAAKDLSVPQLLVDQPGRRIWLKTDDDFEVPKADVTLAFLSDYPSQSARHQAMAQLYARVINEELNEYIYPAYLAGMDYAFYSQLRGFTLRLGGYSDGLNVLTKKIVPALTTVNISESRFISVKAELRRSWSLAMESTPYQRLGAVLQRALYANRASELELIDTLTDISIADLQAFIDEFWTTAYIEALLHGNIDQAGALKLAKHFEPLVDCGCAVEGRTHINIVKLPPGQILQPQTLSHADAAIVWYFQAPDDGIESAALTMLTAAVIHPDFYNQLRTEQQLGYVVSAKYLSLLKWPGLVLQVQSPSTDEQGLFDAIKNFIQLRVVDTRVDSEAQQSEFEQHRQALAMSLRELDTNLNRRSQRLWASLAIADEQFVRKEQLAQAVDGITFSQWQDFAKRLLVTEEASLIQITARLSDGDRQAVKRPVGSGATLDAARLVPYR